jgi:hypothetical protein
MINRVPQPPLLAFATHKTPHFIHLGGLNVPKDDVNVRRIKRVEYLFIHLFDGRLFFFEYVDDRGRTDPQDTDDIPYATAIECHVDDLLFHGWQTPFVAVL